MEALFIENTSQAIKDYFNKSNESTIATSAQKSSLQGDSNESFQNMYTQDCQNTVGEMTKNGQHNKEEGDTAIISTADQRNDGSEFVISEVKEKLPTAEDNPRYTTLRLLDNCGWFDNFNMGLWKSLTSILIGSNCCMRCKTFVVSSCPKLLSINIGESSFISAKLDIRGIYLFCPLKYRV